ncbi:MAG: hypothetical protein JF626_03270, partial [Polaromonas sp.]|nr:hypothetical protein [Polaromonas sp.]
EAGFGQVGERGGFGGVTARLGGNLTWNGFGHRFDIAGRTARNLFSGKPH